MTPVIFHAQAPAELDEAVAYYNSQHTGLGLDLLIEVERAIEAIQQNPLTWPRYKHTEIRQYRLRQFPFGVFYADHDNSIW